ncbi:endonuclease/exonuclease/phosphatase family protein [Porphyromonas sp. COT-290 OH860]|uniref:endonuclease/exonuclease/phosphatase family protein n=1 Tax=Porphyromonas sp. COT-290 OH860 TaxID=1515615 RepID=UPI00052DFFFC|nr:endonuclease/exonuclease/phosphatase family protein [Porphyromonas sp. COT-290 OH860]KGN86104.1 endonuclease [Porphyromonas sp. COT-290 OH860]
MRKLMLTASLALMLLGVGQGYAQKYAKISVAFYNLENLFDTQDGPNNDADFLPNGSNQWTPERYQMKLDNMAAAINQIAEDRAPDILGVCELENRQVLEDLIAHPTLAAHGYSIVHFDSPDRRGIDCALLYRGSVFKFTDARPHPVNISGEPEIKTRDVLEVNGTILGEPVSILVAHWPSRAGGEQISLNRRMSAAKVMKRVTDSLTSIGADQKVILMGDFNDDPVSPSLTKGLMSKNQLDEIREGDLFNVMAKLHRQGLGTLAYRDVWNLFDNIVVTSNLIGSDLSTLKLLEDKTTKAYGRICNSSMLTQKTGQFKGYPFRTFSYGQFQNGYSDHYPVYVYLVRQL